MFLFFIFILIALHELGQYYLIFKFLWQLLDRKSGPRREYHSKFDKYTHPNADMVDDKISHKI